jgi:hypothetical protein
MEYFKGVFINDIVQNFKRIGVPVKTDKQVPGIKLFLPIAVVKTLIVQHIIKSRAYIRLAYAVFESRPTESDINIHDFSILQGTKKRKVAAIR